MANPRFIGNSRSGAVFCADVHINLDLFCPGRARRRPELAVTRQRGVETKPSFPCIAPRECLTQFWSQ
eukprot:600409-Lingulodinium_polyedra.AAC.1